MNNMINDLIQIIKIFMQASLEQEMSPQKKWNSPIAEPNGLREEKALQSRISQGMDQVSYPGLTGCGRADDWRRAHVQQDPQMGQSTLECLEAREDFRHQLEAIMDATKVPKCFIFMIAGILRVCIKVILFSLWESFKMWKWFLSAA